MKLAHLSDTHLGYRRYHYTVEGGRNTRERDFYKAFERAIDEIIELQPDAIVHSGDLFDGFHPSNTAMLVAVKQFKRLQKAQIPTVVIAGNHSTPRVAATDHIFGLFNQLDCVTAVHVQPEVIEIGELAVTAIPHCNDPAQLREWINAARPSTAHRFNVLVAHVGLEGLGRVGASEAGNVEVSGEALEAVAGEFTYVALGHLHKYDRRARMNAVYAGSLERVTWADDAPEKGFVEVGLAADPLGDEFVKLHPIEGRRFLRLPEVVASQTDNLTDAIVAAAERDDLDGTVVQLPIRDVPVEAFAAIDRRAIAKAFEHCLHLELDADFVDATSAGPSPGAPQELRDFLSTRVPRGVDADMFIARAEAYMTKAAEEIGA
ncbi:MAG: exonuclease SbcCD subunit D [Baekduia sp.]